ncbi:MAG: nucleotide exchange factor GrpE [Polyangiaceae bacterium]|nr:nucleotide exchange factor GrpE [Polyangiaceae bacterium]MCE7891511.1 nucleotide exchange factor GrpE [Sorangiineae bacterium PRO1]MCL4750014.1 nucleotide exchange factor GrpE [Myxococcales bacterium]
MTDENQPEGQDNGGAPPEAAETPPPEQPAPDPLAEAKAEAAKFREQLLRTAADFDNFRKRTRKELTDAEIRGREDLLKDLLPVFDNLERAMSHADAATDVQALADGLRMVSRQFLDTLGKLGIERVQSVGQPFDPAVHEAIQHLESADHPAGVVLTEVQAGYRQAERLLRPALVVVSKGAPKPSESPAPAEEPS